MSIHVHPANHSPTAYDYVEVRRDFLAWTPAQQHQSTNGSALIPTHGIEEHQNMHHEMSHTNGPRASDEAAEKPLPPASSDRSR